MVIDLPVIQNTFQLNGNMIMLVCMRDLSLMIEVTLMLMMTILKKLMIQYSRNKKKKKILLNCQRKKDKKLMIKKKEKRRKQKRRKELFLKNKTLEKLKLILMSIQQSKE